MLGADPTKVSMRAKKRGLPQARPPPACGAPAPDGGRRPPRCSLRRGRARRRFLCSLMLNM